MIKFLEPSSESDLEEESKVPQPTILEKRFGMGEDGFLVRIGLYQTWHTRDEVGRDFIDDFERKQRGCLLACGASGFASRVIVKVLFLFVC
jgi:hypothetical protein